MQRVSQRPGAFLLLTALALPVSSQLSAQTNEVPPAASNIVVSGIRMPAGPDVKGIIAARNEDKIKVVAADGTASVITVTEETKIKASGGLFGGGAKLGADALLNGLPVTVKTRKGDDGVLFASQIIFKNGDLKTARMIRQGTEQQFAEQTAATEALRGRVADIDNYNIKGTTNVYFATGKWALSPQSKNELCTAASQADATNNAMILVVGYTDSVGSEEYNQVLSEKRAGAVINYLQQYCRWKPYRMLTPTGMAEADPLADNSTEEGKAQNRRVSVNVLVSKGLDGM
jgi:OOP family OmpA-OmpF porin